MELSALEGVTFGPYRMRVCLEKVTEFLDVVGGDRTRWAEAAPPGYMAAALFVVAPELLAKLDGFSVIHGEQTFRWHRPLEMEQDLLVSGTVTKIRERSGSYFVSFEMTVTGHDFEVAGGTSLFLVSPSAAPGNIKATLPENDPQDQGPVGSGQRSASRSDLVRYAAATRDWNPIHWDHGSALAAGLDQVVVHGLLQGAWALDAASESTDGLRPFESARVRFRNPLPPATAVDVAVTGGEGKLSVDVSGGDTQYLTAQIEVAGE